MSFTTEKMTKATAVEILRWRYPHPYDFYNNEVTDEALADMLAGTYWAVRNKEGELFGFYCTGKSSRVPHGRKMNVYPETFIDFGLGIKPAEIGQGKGTDFFAYIRREIAAVFPEKPLRLTVAVFNKRAIRLYEKAGFEKNQEFKNDFAVFQTMVESENPLNS